MKKLLVAAAFGATLLGAPAFAQDGPPPPPQPGGPMMRDPLLRGEGVVTREQVLADVAARFAKMDTNHDGKISPEERAAAREERRGGRGPGGPGGRMAGDLTLADMQAQAMRRFDRIDTNHDGKIDQAERDAARDRMMAMRDRRGPPPPPPADTPAN